MHRLKSVMLQLIAREAPLDTQWRDHPLRAEWSCYRECHIGRGFLLIYKIDDESGNGVVIFIRAGTHSDLFDE